MEGYLTITDDFVRARGTNIQLIVSAGIFLLC